MVSTILVTKLHIPPTRPKLVPRFRLIEHLNNGLHRKLTLISAPAGFGKTTLVGGKLDNLQQKYQEWNTNCKKNSKELIHAAQHRNSATR